MLQIYYQSKKKKWKDRGDKAPGRRQVSFVGAEIWVQTAEKVQLRK